MIIPYTKAQRIDKLSCMFVAGRVVLPMQSIGGDNDGTYTSYMFPLTPRALGLAGRPCSGPWQPKFDDY